MSCIKNYLFDCGEKMAEKVSKITNLSHLHNEIYDICIDWIFEYAGECEEHLKLTFESDTISEEMYNLIALGVVAEEAGETEIGKACRAAQQKYLPKK